MNYRHAYHAGGFADVVKHAVFCRVLTHLCEKPAAFRVIDTHAGAGLYDLAGPEATKTGEWHDGIERLRNATLDDAPRALLAPYLDAVASFNPTGTLATYPGSPEIARILMRRQDRLIACELEPDAALALERTLHPDARAKAITIDGWTALSAYVPPKERRGVVLVDPPFEQPDEFTRLADSLIAAHRKWPTGIYLLWYPVKEAAPMMNFIQAIARARIAKSLRTELIVAPSADESRLRGSGLIVVNPPWKLHDELQIMLPALARALRPDGQAALILEWLTAETAR